MLEQVDLSKKLSQEEYEDLLPGLRQRFLDLQQTCREQAIASIIVFEGWDNVGIGTAINAVTGPLDPDQFKVYTIHPPKKHERGYPWMWRFWQKIPAYGELAVFDWSWYSRVLVERVEKLTPHRKWRKAYRDIVDFERMLADDGVVLVKLWFHISKKKHKKLWKKQDSKTGKASSHRDWMAPDLYDAYLIAATEMLERTNTDRCPWAIVEANSHRYAHKKTLDTIITQFEKRLGT